MLFGPTTDGPDITNKKAAIRQLSRMLAGSRISLLLSIVFESTVHSDDTHYQTYTLTRVAEAGPGNTQRFSALLEQSPETLIVLRTLTRFTSRITPQTEETVMTKSNSIHLTLEE